MDYKSVIAFYGSQSRAARALDCSQASVAEWKTRGVPVLRQYQIEVLSKGSLKASAHVDKPPRSITIKGRTASADAGAMATTHGAKQGAGGKGGSGSDLQRERVRPKPKTKAKAKAKAKAIEQTTESAPALEVSKPMRASPGGAAARLALMEAGPKAARDATRPNDAPADLAPLQTPGLIAAPVATPLLPVRLPAWRKSTQGILAKAKALGVPLYQGDKWGDVIARIEQAQAGEA
jgi:hypothetical protein